MSPHLTVLGLVPARGGSRGVPRKNVRLLHGRPLLQYTAEAALAAKRLSTVVLTTDDEEIARVGRDCGLEVPFLRPADLAGDATPMLPVVQHALRWLEARGEWFDAVCLLQPTSPLRTAALIDRCIDRLDASGADTVLSVLPVPVEYNPHWVFVQRPDGTLHLSTGEPAPIGRRQELPPAFRRDGSVYVTRRDTVLERGSLYGATTVGCIVAPEDTVNVDDEDDWREAEERLRAAGR